MPVIRQTQTIKRSVAEVFATVVDGARFADWNPTVKRSRQLTPGEPGEGTQFEWRLRGFGNVRQELQEFERDRRVRIVPHMRSMGGGHRFTFTDHGGETQIDHELEMTPKGAFKVFTPMMGMIGRKNLRDTTTALEAHLQSGTV